MNTFPTKALALIALAGTAAASANAQNINWNNGAGGLWNAPANWTPATVPSMATETAVFSIGGTYTATLNITANGLGSVSIFDPDCTLSTNTGVTLGVQNGIFNNGLILINNTNGGFASNFNFNSSGMISGTGTITLNGTGTRSQLNAPGGVTVTHGAGHTINGIGRITGNFINDGTISASTPGQSLDLFSGTWTNNSSLEVINNATMNLNSLDITQSASGELRVEDGTLNLNHTNVTNGTIRALPGFSWTGIQGTNTLDSVHLIGDGSSNSGVHLNLINTIQNDGTLIINNTNGGFQSNLQFQTPFALNGTGEILLNRSASRSVLTTLNSSDEVTQAFTHTIHGQGIIQASIVNNGEIVADYPATLTLNTNDQTNNNIFRVTNDAVMTINSIAVDQQGGGSIQIDSGRLDLNAATLVGGAIYSGDGFALLNSGVSIFEQIRTDAPVSMNTGTTLLVVDGLINNSTLTINNSNGGFATTLFFTDSSTLSGAGTTRLNGTTSRAQLNTEIGETVTIANGHLVQGFGQINPSLINNGFINSTSPGQILYLLTNDKVNNGLIAAEPDANITVNGITITQDPSAQIDLGDGSMTLSNATIIDGTINSTTGEVLQSSGTSTFQQLTNNAPISMNTGTTINIANGLVNNSTITVNNTGGGFATSLVFTDSSTLSGTGTIALNGASSRAQLNSNPGETGTIDSSQSVRGFGQINASLINNGLIEASGSGQTLSLQTSDKVNNSILLIQPGATMSINNIEIEQSTEAIILNINGLLLLSGATINGGTIDIVDTGSIIISAS